MAKQIIGNKCCLVMTFQKRVTFNCFVMKQKKKNKIFMETYSKNFQRYSTYYLKAAILICLTIVFLNKILQFLICFCKNIENTVSGR